MGHEEKFDQTGGKLARLVSGLLLKRGNLLGKFVSLSSKGYFLVYDLTELNSWSISGKVDQFVWVWRTSIVQPAPWRIVSSLLLSLLNVIFVKYLN